MSHKNYSESEPTDDEISEYLQELYPQDVSVCGYKMSQVFILKRMDRIAFEMFASDNMNWFECGVCGKIYKDDDDAEENARECCQEYCSECGEALYKDENCNSEDDSVCFECVEDEE